ALRVAGGYDGGTRAVVLGAGGTAAAAVVAFADLGVTSVRLVVREPARAGETTEAARRAGLDVDVLRWSEVDMAALTADTDVLVSTVPSEALTADLEAIAGVGCVLDVIYHPGPTPLADAVAARGGWTATGPAMLLHPALGQGERFTGRTAPTLEMPP